MPTIARYDDGMRFVIRSNDHAPPHAHIEMSNGEEWRIDLLSGEFIDQPPARVRKIITRRYRDKAEELLAEWEKYHPYRW